MMTRMTKNVHRHEHNIMTNKTWRWWSSSSGWKWRHNWQWQQSQWCDIRYFSTFSWAHTMPRDRQQDEVLGRPLLAKCEMTGQIDDQVDGWRGGSGQHTGVLWVHVSHAGGGIRTHSALVHWVVKGWLFCHVVVWRRGRRHSDSLSLQPAGEKRAQQHQDGANALIYTAIVQGSRFEVLTLRSRYRSPRRPPRWLRSE